MNKHITLFKMPATMVYAQFKEDILKLEKVDVIEYNTPTIILFNDSLYTRLVNFVMVYQGRMYFTNGDNAIANPTSTWFAFGNDRYEHNIITLYNSTIIWKMIVRNKYKLIAAKYGFDNVPMFYWDLKEIDVPGLLVGKIEMVGMGLLPIDSLVVERKDKRLLLTRV